MRINVAFLVGVLLAVILLGCRDTQPPTTPVDPVSRANYPRNISLRGLTEVVVSAEPVVEPATAQRPMRVTVPVRSLHDEAIHAQYMFEFFNAQGQPIGRSAGWQYKALPPQMQVFLEGYAIDTSATDWRVTIRPAR